jgi:hypothetical protein
MVHMVPMMPMRSLRRRDGANARHRRGESNSHQVTFCVFGDGDATERLSSRQGVFENISRIMK